MVVVHGSDAATVQSCVESLLGSKDVDMHVVLVDNASPDGGAACSPWRDRDVDGVHLITSTQNAGFAAGVNIGLVHRRHGDMICLLNDDATVEPTALLKLTAVLADDRSIVAAAPRVMLAGQPDFIDSIGVVIRSNGEAFNAFIGQRWNDQVHDGADVFGPCFGAALFRADAFDATAVGADAFDTTSVGADAFDATAVGPIDERYRLYYEDIDWSLRAQRIGLRTVAVTDAVVFHQHAASTRLLGEPARYELVQRNLLLCAAKNFTIAAALRVWGARIVVHAKGIIKGPYRAERVRSIARAVWGLPSVLMARRQLPRVRAVDEQTLFAYSAGLEPNFDTDTYRANTYRANTDPPDPQTAP